MEIQEVFLTSEAPLRNTGDLLQITEVLRWTTGVSSLTTGALQTLGWVLVGLQCRTLASCHLRTLEQGQTATDRATVEMAASVNEVLPNI